MPMQYILESDFYITEIRLKDISPDVSPRTSPPGQNAPYGMGVWGFCPHMGGDVQGGWRLSGGDVQGGLVWGMMS